MNKSQSMLLVVLAVVVVALGVSNVYTYRKYSALQENPQKVAQETVEKLVSEVNNIYELPTDETPTVATVTDPSKLKDQPFFAKAKEGDKVLIYTNARLAIIYDPTTKKIVQVAPVTIGNGQSVDVAPAATNTPAAKQ